MLLRGARGWRWDQGGTKDQEVPGPVARTRVATRGAPLTCDATPVTPPIPEMCQDPRVIQGSESAKSPARPGQAGLYIGSVCNREGGLYFLLPPPRPLSGAGGEDIFKTKHRHHK